MKPKITPHQKLIKARQLAGYNTATEAIEKFNWKNSTYRAHENGQNKFNRRYAELYSKAYKVDLEWLITVDDDQSISLAPQDKNQPNTQHKHNCVEHIHAMSILLTEDQENLSLLVKIKSCAESQIKKIIKNEQTD